MICRSLNSSSLPCRSSRPTIGRSVKGPSGVVRTLSISFGCFCWHGIGRQWHFASGLPRRFGARTGVSLIGVHGPVDNKARAFSSWRGYGKAGYTDGQVDGRDGYRSKRQKGGQAVYRPDGYAAAADRRLFSGRSTAARAAIPRYGARQARPRMESTTGNIQIKDCGQMAESEIASIPPIMRACPKSARMVF